MWQKYINRFRVYVRKLRYDCEARRIGGLRNNFDPLQFLSVHPMDGTGMFLHIRPRSPALSGLAVQRQGHHATQAGFGEKYEDGRLFQRDYERQWSAINFASASLLPWATRNEAVTFLSVPSPGKLQYIPIHSHCQALCTAFSLWGLVRVCETVSHIIPGLCINPPRIPEQGRLLPLFSIKYCQEPDWTLLFTEYIQQLRMTRSGASTSWDSA